MVVRFLIILLSLNILFPVSHSANINPRNDDGIFIVIGNKKIIGEEYSSRWGGKEFYNIGIDIPFTSYTWPKDDKIRKLFENIQFGFAYTNQKSFVPYQYETDGNSIASNFKGRQAYINIFFPSLSLNIGYSFNYFTASYEYTIENIEVIGEISEDLMAHLGEILIENTIHLGFKINDESKNSFYYGLYNLRGNSKQIIDLIYPDDSSFTTTTNFPEFNVQGIEVNYHHLINDRIGISLKYIHNFESDYLLDYEYSLSTYIYL